MLTNWYTKLFFFLFLLEQIFSTEFFLHKLNLLKLSFENVLLIHFYFEVFRILEHIKQRLKAKLKNSKKTGIRFLTNSNFTYYFIFEVF